MDKVVTGAAGVGTVIDRLKFKELILTEQDETVELTNSETGNHVESSQERDDVNADPATMVRPRRPADFFGDVVTTRSDKST